MQGLWSDESVKMLFGEVEKVKAGGGAIKDAFASFARKQNRKPNSVRNYYYAEIARLHADGNRAKKLGIDLTKHQKSEFAFFSQEEKDKIVGKIQEKLNEGCSVRKACYLLSGGNVKEMLRMQNKYRAETRQSNVLPFKKRQQGQVTDADIASLFAGIVKLVRRNAVEQVRREIAVECQESEGKLRELMLKLGQKERELQFLQAELTRLKNENALLKKRLLISTCLKAKELSEKEKQA